MINHLTLEAARAMANEDLVAAMREGFMMAEKGILTACVSICVLEERGVDLPMLPDVYRHAREIAEGKLSAHAGLILGRFPFAIKAVMPLPITLQDEIADGKKIKVATKADGRIRCLDLTIFEMSQMQMRLAFSDEGITPWEQQGEWLLKTGHQEAPVSAAAKKASIAVDAKRGDIVVGRTHVSVDDLIPALAALGFAVKPLYAGKNIQPALVK